MGMGGRKGEDWSERDRNGGKRMRVAMKEKTKMNRRGFKRVECLSFIEVIRKSIYLSTFLLIYSFLLLFYKFILSILVIVYLFIYLFILSTYLFVYFI